MATTQNALGTAQSNPELAHKELTLARAAYTKAKERLDLAETEYTNSRLTLNKAVESIQQFSTCSPLVCEHGTIRTPGERSEQYA